MTKQTLLLTAVFAGDGAGVTSPNAALYMQRMPHLTLAVTPGSLGVLAEGRL